MRLRQLCSALKTLNSKVGWLTDWQGHLLICPGQLKKRSFAFPKFISWLQSTEELCQSFFTWVWWDQFAAGGGAPSGKPPIYVFWRLQYRVTWFWIPNSMNKIPNVLLKEYFSPLTAILADWDLATEAWHGLLCVLSAKLHSSATRQVRLLSRSTSVVFLPLQSLWMDCNPNMFGGSSSTWPRRICHYPLKYSIITKITQLGEG